MYIENLKLNEKPVKSSLLITYNPNNLSRDYICDDEKANSYDKISFNKSSSTTLYGFSLYLCKNSDRISNLISIKSSQSEKTGYYEVLVPTSIDIEFRKIIKMEYKSGILNGSMKLGFVQDICDFGVNQSGILSKPLIELFDLNMHALCLSILTKRNTFVEITVLDIPKMNALIAKNKFLYPKGRTY